MPRQQAQSQELKADFSQLLKDAVNTPGRMLEAYRAFYNYSFGNRLWLMQQLYQRGIPVGPVATYKKWTEKGRIVKRGEKALAILMPVTIDRNRGQEGADPSLFMMYRPKNCLFTVSQTDGPADGETPAIELPKWNRKNAMASLGIEMVDFQHINGNVQGYASERKIAINPLAQLPAKTMFHEIAHIILGHTDVTQHDTAELPRNIMEVEAEGVALLCLESLGLPGSDYCRGYIQNWLGTGGQIEEKVAKRIMKAADQIIKAGTKTENTNE
jgi:antirestriction protein ArdC